MYWTRHPRDWQPGGRKRPLRRRRHQRRDGSVPGAWRGLAGVRLRSSPSCLAVEVVRLAKGRAARLVVQPVRKDFHATFQPIERGTNVPHLPDVGQQDRQAVERFNEQWPFTVRPRQLKSLARSVDLGVDHSAKLWRAKANFRHVDERHFAPFLHSAGPYRAIRVPAQHQTVGQDRVDDEQSHGVAKI